MKTLIDNIKESLIKGNATGKTKTNYNLCNLIIYARVYQIADIFTKTQHELYNEGLPKYTGKFTLVSNWDYKHRSYAIAVVQGKEFIEFINTHRTDLELDEFPNKEEFMIIRKLKSEYTAKSMKEAYLANEGSINKFGEKIDYYDIFGK